MNESNRNPSTVQAQINLQDGHQTAPCNTSSSQINLSNVRLRYEADGREQHDFAAVAAAAPPPPPLPGINCRRILNKMRPGGNNYHMNNVAPAPISNGMIGLNNGSSLSLSDNNQCYTNFPIQEQHDSPNEPQANQSVHYSNHLDCENMLDSVLRSMQSTQDNLSDLIRASATGNNVMHLLLLQNQQMIQQQQLMLMVALSERNNCCRHSHSHRATRSASTATVQTGDYGASMSSSTPLNNQGTPGFRPNNYYDNFRSNTRQNQLGTHTVPSSNVSPSNYSLQQQQQASSTFTHVHLLDDNSESTGRSGTIKRPDDRYTAVSIEQMLQKLNDRQGKSTNLEAGHGNCISNSSDTLDQFTSCTAAAAAGGAGASASISGSSNDLPVLESASGAIRKKSRDPPVKSNDRPSAIGLFKETNRSVSNYSNETTGAIPTSNGNCDPLIEASRSTGVPSAQLTTSSSVSPSLPTHLSTNSGPSNSTAVGASVVAAEAIVTDDEVDDEDTDDIRLSGDGEQGL